MRWRHTGDVGQGKTTPRNDGGSGGDTTTRAATATMRHARQEILALSAGCALLAALRQRELVKHLRVDHLLLVRLGEDGGAAGQLRPHEPPVLVRRREPEARRLYVDAARHFVLLAPAAGEHGGRRARLATLVGTRLLHRHQQHDAAAPWICCVRTCEAQQPAPRRKGRTDPPLGNQRGDASCARKKRQRKKERNKPMLYSRAGTLGTRIAIRELQSLQDHDLNGWRFSVFLVA